MQRNASITIILVLSMALLTGCAGQIKSQDIAPAAIQLAQRHPQTVLVQTSGGGETTLGAFNVDNATMQQAIVDSIASSGLFSRAVKSGNADYRLDVLLTFHDQPNDGLTMTSTAHILWKLTRLSDGNDVFQDVIETTDSKTLGDAFVGATRARMAFEGAIRKNIKEGLERVSKTSF